MTLLTTYNTSSEAAVEAPKMGHQSVTVRNNEMVYFENLATIMTNKRGYLLQTTLVRTVCTTCNAWHVFLVTVRVD